MVEAKANESVLRFCARRGSTSTMASDSFHIEELGTDRNPSLEDAQRAALPRLAELLAFIVRQGIEEGSLVVVNGMVRLGHVCESEELADGAFTNSENDV